MKEQNRETYVGWKINGKDTIKHQGYNITTNKSPIIIATGAILYGSFCGFLQNRPTRNTRLRAGLRADRLLDLWALSSADPWDRIKEWQNSPAVKQFTLDFIGKYQKLHYYRDAFHL